MKQTRTPREWFDTYVNKDKLRDDIIKALEEAVNNDSMDFDGENYLGLVHDVINGANGQFIPFYALEYFDYENIDTDNINQYDFEYVINELESFTMELEDIMNEEVAEEIGATVQFGYWESDSSFCLMVFMPISVYDSHVEQFEGFMNGGSVGL